MPTRVLFVCLGNICRSPLAEAIFVHKARSLGISESFEVDSCGTSSYNVGDGPDPRTLANAARNGVEMNHVARQMRFTDFEDFDRIVVMDSNNFRNSLELSHPAHHSKIVMMRAFDPAGPGDVPDPYYGAEKGFQEVFEILDRAVEGLIRDLRKQHKS